MELQKSNPYRAVYAKRDPYIGNDAGGRVVSNIFDEYLPKLIIRIETPELIWEMWEQ